MRVRFPSSILIIIDHNAGSLIYISLFIINSIIVVPHITQIYYVRHNNFKFTIKIVSPKIDEKFFKQYLQDCADALPQEVIKLGEIIVGELRADAHIAYLSIQALDYGMPQVGIHLVAAWVEQLYKHCDGFIIDAIIIHPKADPPARGAVIRWDYTNDCPVVEILVD